VAKRWINSADVLVDDQGRVAVLLPAELVQNNRLKVDAAGVTLTADIIDLDVQAITGAPPYARTLADLNDRLEYGLFDYGYPFFQELRWDLEYYLYNNWYGYEPWLATVDRSINDGFYYQLYNQWNYEPWMQTLHYDLDWLLHSPWGGTVAEMLYAMQYDLADVRWTLADMRAILQDVYDSSGHALRTIGA
jgi:hypothetical protein